jgi:K+-sensing histidine kinase KdpD
MLGTVRVLLVDDDAGYRDLLTTALADAENLGVEAFDCPLTALSWATENEDAVDCVVSDFDMPAMTGGEFHDALRQAGIDVPFVLVSGSDSADIPPEATADATAFVRKGAGSLFDVRAAVNDATRAVRKGQTLAALHETTDALMRADDREAVANAAVETAEEVLNFPGTGVRFYDPDRDALVAASVGGQSDEAVDERPPFPVEGTHHGRAFRAGETVTYDVPEDSEDDPYDAKPFGRTMYVPLGGHGVVSFGKNGDGPFDEQDVQFAETLAGHAATALDRIERERALERERDRLEEVTSVVSHDLRNPLNVAGGAVELAAAECADDDVVEHLATADQATDRVASLIDDLLTLTRGGRRVEDFERVDVADTARQAWGVVETGEATLTVDDGLGTVDADPAALSSVFENVFRNSIEHGATDDPLRVALEATADGFAVVDDGAGFGIDPGTAFERSVSTRESGEGLGLSIVDEIAGSHGWHVDVGESAAGGARLEIVTDAGSDPAAEAFAHSPEGR